MLALLELSSTSTSRACCSQDGNPAWKCRWTRNRPPALAAAPRPLSVCAAFPKTMVIDSAEKTASNHVIMSKSPMLHHPEAIATTQEDCVSTANVPLAQQVPEGQRPKRLALKVM